MGVLAGHRRARRPFDEAQGRPEALEGRAHPIACLLGTTHPARQPGCLLNLRGARVTHTRSAVALGILMATQVADLSATAVIALRTKDAVYLAGDTKGPPTGTNERFSSCKVIASEHVIIGFSGLAAVPAIRYELRAVLQQLASRNLPFRQQVDSINQALQLFLHKVVEAARRLSPAYRQKLESQRQILAVLIAGMDEGVPTWQVRHYFRRLNKERGTAQYLFRETVCGKDCGEAGVAVLGGTQGLRTALRQVKGEDLAADWSGQSTRIIGIAAKESPDTIALPAAAVRVDGQGVRWLQQPAGCTPESTP
jgi:hypothetical protein